MKKPARKPAKKSPRSSSRLGSAVLMLTVAVLAAAGGYWLATRKGAGGQTGTISELEVPPPKAKPAAATPRPRPTATPRPARVEGVPSDFEPAEESPAATSKKRRGVLAIVLDDVGWDRASLDRLEGFSGPLALAVMPDAPKTAEAAALAKRKGWDLLVHLPMAPSQGGGEPTAIGPGDSDAAIQARVEDALGKVTGAIGLNNHQGSRATSDVRVMRAVLSVVKRRGLFFLDSRTTASSVAESEARKMGVSTLRRDVFLDDAGEEAAAGTTIALRESWDRALALAASQGHCVAIGHPRPETLSFLSSALREAEKKGLVRVKVSSLVD